MSLVLRPMPISCLHDLLDLFSALDIVGFVANFVLL